MPPLPCHNADLLRHSTIHGILHYAQDASRWLWARIRRILLVDTVLLTGSGRDDYRIVCKAGCASTQLVSFSSKTTAFPQLSAIGTSILNIEGATMALYPDLVAYTLIWLHRNKEWHWFSCLGRHLGAVCSLWHSKKLFTLADAGSRHTNRLTTAWRAVCGALQLVHASHQVVHPLLLPTVCYRKLSLSDRRLFRHVRRGGLHAVIGHLDALLLQPNRETLGHDGPRLLYRHVCGLFCSCCP